MRILTSFSGETELGEILLTSMRKVSIVSDADSLRILTFMPGTGESELLKIVIYV